jgi:hypothetical protein
MVYRVWRVVEAVKITCPTRRVFVPEERMAVNVLGRE